MPRFGSFTSAKTLSVLRKKLTALVASSTLFPRVSLGTYGPNEGIRIEKVQFVSTSGSLIGSTQNFTFVVKNSSGGTIGTYTPGFSLTLTYANVATYENDGYGSYAFLGAFMAPGGWNAGANLKALLETPGTASLEVQWSSGTFIINIDASANLLPFYSTATLLWSVSNPNPEGIFPDNDDFGASVVVGDTWVAVGAPYEPAGKSTAAGGVYILNTTSGSLSTTISNPDSPANGTYYDKFGSTMVKTPDSRILFVAAIGEDPSDVANTNYGIVYAFDTSNWSLKYSISPSTTDQYLYFGSSMAADNYHIAIAEPSSNLVRIFEAESGTQVAFIQNPNVQSGASTADYFGNSLYISSSTLVVGVPYEDAANSAYFGFQNTGGIVVYNWQTSTSTYVNYIPNPDGVYNTYFGSYMTGGNNKLYVSDRVSTIYSYNLSTITTPSVSPSTQTSAISIANAFNGPTVYPWKVAGDTLFFGNNVLPGSSYSGRVYALNTSTLATKFVIENPNTRADTTSSDNFGYSLDVNGNLLVVGAMENVDSSSSGTVYFFRLE